MPPRTMRLSVRTSSLRKSPFPKLQRTTKKGFCNQNAVSNFFQECQNKIKDPNYTSVSCLVTKLRPPEGRQLPKIPVALREAFCIAFFKCISFVGGQLGLYYVKKLEA